MARCCSGAAVAGRGGAAAEEDGAHGPHGGGDRAAAPARARCEGHPAETPAARRSGGVAATLSLVPLFLDQIVLVIHALFKSTICTTSIAYVAF